MLNNWSFNKEYRSIRKKVLSNFVIIQEIEFI